MSKQSRSNRGDTPTGAARRALRVIPRLAVRRPWTILGVAALLTVAAVLLGLRIEVKTSFWDTMSETEPTIRRINYLASNFPSAITAQVLLEGRDPGRLIEVGEALERRFLEDPALVRGVYLRQDLEFFQRRALLYLPVDELRLIDGQLAKHEAELARLVTDPSVLGLLRAVETIGQELFPAEDTAMTLSSRVFGKVLLDEALAGRPAARVGLRVDPGPIARRLEQQTLTRIRDVPVPPSDSMARRNLMGARDLFDLIADVLEQGERLDHGAFHKRFETLLEVGAAEGSLPQRYSFSADKEKLLLEVAAVHDVTRIEHMKPFVAHLEAVVSDVQASAQDVRIGLTGMPVMYAQDERAVLDNFALVSILGLLGILAVFIIGFEQVGLPSLAVIPLLMGVLWTLGIQGAVVPELNMFNLLFPVLLFGLGIDFAIHIINGFTHRRSQGDDTEAALVSCFETVVPGLLAGAITTAAAFLVLLVASLKGVRDLGFTAGIGVAMALIAMLTVLPALLVLWDRRRDRRGELVPHVTFVAIARIGGLVQRSRYGILALFMAVTIVLAYFAPRVGLERDSGKLQAPDKPAAVLQHKIVEAFEIGLEPSIFFAKDLAEAGRIQRAAEQGRTIGTVLSITQAIPTDQAEKAPLLSAIGEKIERVAQRESPPPHSYAAAELQELRDRLASVKRSSIDLTLLARLIYGAEAQGLVGEVRDALNRIDARVNAASVDRLRYLDSLIAHEVDEALGLFRAMANNRSVSVDDLPRSLVDRVAGEDGAWMVVVRSNRYAFEEDFLNGHVEELESIHSEVAGLVPTWKRMLEKIIADIPLITSLTLAAVALFVLISLRSIRGTVLALTPLLVGLIWTVGVMGLLGIDFNFISIRAIPLIVGIGIDDGVHLYHRIRHERAIGPALTHSGKAIVLTSLTTGIGFGSLLLSVHLGVFYLGLTTAIGIVCCLIVSLLLLPALVAIFDDGLLEPAASEPGTGSGEEER